MPVSRRRIRLDSRRAAACFTLVEIMLVVVIIGLLVATVVPVLAGRVTQARITATRNQMNAIGGMSNSSPWLGAAGGAASGAALGSQVAPGYGTAIGAVLGGIGGYLGSG